MVVACVALALIVLLRFGPDVPFLRVVRLAIVEKPARWLPYVETHQIFALVIIAALVLSGGKLILAFAPDLVALVATNLGIYFDAMAISALLSVVTIVHRVARIIRVQWGQRRAYVGRTFRGELREVRTRPVVRKSVADNEDHPPAHVLAWAA